MYIAVLQTDQGQPGVFEPNVDLPITVDGREIAVDFQVT